MKTKENRICQEFGLHLLETCLNYDNQNKYCRLWGPLNAISLFLTVFWVEMSLWKSGTYMDLIVRASLYQLFYCILRDKNLILTGAVICFFRTQKQKWPNMFF